MKTSDILKEIKKLTQFDCVVKNDTMLCYNKALRPVVHYEVVNNKLFVVQFNMSYTQIQSFSEFRVDEFNKLNGTDYKLVFEFAK